MSLKDMLKIVLVMIKQKMIGIIGLQRRQLIGYLHNCPYINNKTRPHTYTP